MRLAQAAVDNRGKLTLEVDKKCVLLAEWYTLGTRALIPSSHGDTVIVRVLVVFGEAEPLQGLLCRSCKAARLCAASQDRQTDRQGIGDVFTICSGRTVVMGDDEEERHFHGVRRQSRGTSEDLLPDITHYLSQRPVKHRCACCGTLSALTWKTGQGLTMMLSFFFKYNPPGIRNPKVTGR